MISSCAAVGDSLASHGTRALASRACSERTRIRLGVDPHQDPKAASDESADPVELDARLRRALRIEQRLLSEMGPLLLEVARSRGYRARGCSSLPAFAREQLGMSPRKAQALLRLEEPARSQRSCARRFGAVACRSTSSSKRRTETVSA